ncbi:FAD-binding oxidoreductase [Siminovitchia fortis]|uniref:FAD-binding oxidoreductase n=1 Tax=Siminovitchia fortis TaxID=254758 RepID=A0A443ILM2_9BACI|nr:FAD-binding oxidoreductase [Siminovitchia fortis]RWR06261.1 FAD-binding oxidoreductase [Siminovitchia fortis]WHY81096.1 FAD-binding oxidoreductase [Siminovitchia fortis]
MDKIIVIGAGIFGASTAYHLAKAGADVTVIDRKDMGQATDAAAGIVCPWLSQRRSKDWYRLAKTGAAFYPGLITELEEIGETETGYARVGAISLHKDREKLLQMKERALKRLEDAPEIGEIKLLDANETRALFPPLAEGFGSVYVSGAARVNGRRLREALLRSAERLGAHRVYGDAKLVLDGKKVEGVEANGSFYDSTKVVITAGAWIRELMQSIGVDFRSKDLKAQIVHMELPETQTGNWPVIMPPGSQYIVPFEDGRIVAGATYENFTHFDLRVTAGGMHEILEKALETAPGLIDSTILETRVGFRPYTPESIPVLGKLPGFENILIGNGLGATGLTAGPYLGSELACLALGKEPKMDLSLYRVERALE